MTEPIQRPDKYYPPRNAFRSHEEWYAHIETYNNVYAMQDNLKAILDKLSQHENAIQSNASNIRRVAIVDNINGIAIKKSIPTNGQVLKYNSNTGQAEWT